MAPAIRMGGRPGVGILWKLDGRLIIDGVSLEEAIEDGTQKTYPGTHEELWRRYSSIMIVPFIKQESLARGRVVFDLVAQRFLLYADLCIISDAGMLGRIREHLNLPPNTEIAADPEYRCSNCSPAS